jgi:hypothetical protein
MVRRLILALVVSFIIPAILRAAPPKSETLLPGSTLGYLAVDDVAALEAAFQATELGQLFEEPQMRTFVEDLRRQINEKLTKASEGIELTWDDMEGLAGGEVALALVRGPDQRPAVVFLLDVTGKQAQAQAVLDRVSRSLVNKKAVRSEKKVGDTTVVLFQLPKKADDPGPERTAVYFLKGDLLGAAGSLDVAEGVLGRLSGTASDDLSHNETYRVVTERCRQASGDTVPHVRWFAQPLAYALALRELHPPKNPPLIVRPGARPRPSTGPARTASTQKPRTKSSKSTDMVKLLQNQGFTAVQGAGGMLTFHVDDRFQMVHRVAVHAPPPFSLAMRMLSFENAIDMAPAEWVPQEVAQHTVVNWNMHDAFQAAGSLVDEVIGEPGVWEDLLDSIKNDKDGRAIDIEKDMIETLGTRATLVADYATPITPHSQQLLFAAETSNPEGLVRTIDKAFRGDKTVRFRTVGETGVWEMFQDKAPPVDDVGAPRPDFVVTVAHGQFMISNQFELVERIIEQSPQAQRLSERNLFARVSLAAEDLGAGATTYRSFSNTPQSLRATYELIRQGKMPESETLLGKILNRILGDPESESARGQEIDGSKLPEFDTIQDRFGPGGAFGTADFDGAGGFQGWVLTGFLLKSRE